MSLGDVVEQDWIKDQFDILLANVTEAYEADRGLALIEQALGRDGRDVSSQVRSARADRPNNLHADRHSFDGCGRRYSGAEGLAEVDLQAVAVVDARDAHARDGAQAAEDLQRPRLGCPCLVDRGGLRHASQ